MSKILDSYLKLVKKVIPDKEVGSSVGLDIGVDSCKMVEMTKVGNVFKLLNWAAEPIEKENIKEAVNKVLSEVKNPTKSPFTSVFGKGTLIRYVDMPKMTIDDMRRSLAFEADKYFPFPKDQIYTDCYILNPKPKDNKVPVLVAAAKKELVDERLALLSSVGLQADFIGLNPIALSNALNTITFAAEAKDGNAEAAGSSLAILDIGNSLSNLVITINNIPHFTRDIYIGGKEVTQRLSNALGISLQEAEQLKRNPDGRGEEIFTAVESVLLNLINEIRLSFDYFTTEHNFYISKVLLTGGMSSLEGINEFVSRNLDVEVSQWDPFKSVMLEEHITPEEIKQRSGSLAVALGLALYKF